MKLIAKHSLSAGLAAALCLTASTAVAGKLYKWVDADGNISYQDQPPPDNVKLLEEREVAGIGEGGSNSSPDSDKPEIVIYTVNNCQPCDDMVTHLLKLGVPHIQRPLQDDREAQSRILAQTDSLIAPTIFVGDSIFQGSRHKEVTSAIKEAGYTVKEAPKAPGAGNRLVPEDAVIEEDESAAETPDDELPDIFQDDSTS